MRIVVIVLGVTCLAYWTLARELRRAAFKERAFQMKLENRKLIKIARWLLFW